MSKVKVALITPVLGKNLGIGMSRYGKSIIGRVKKSKGEITPISFSVEGKTGESKRLTDKIFPYSAIKQFIKAIKNKTEIYHFICPELMFYPFAIFQFYFVRAMRKKIVLTMHDLMTLENLDNKRTISFVKPFILSLIRSADKIICNSSQTQREIVEKLGVEKRKTETIVIGVDERFKPLNKKENKIFKVGYLGAFDHVKNPYYAFECFVSFDKRNPGKAELEMWGKGIEAEQIKKEAKKKGISNVKVKGFAPEDKIVEIYNSFDAMIFPSKYEGFGLNILEAVVCGVPVIIKKTSRIPEEVKEMCLLGENEEEIVKILEKLIRRKQFRKRIINRGLLKARRFKWKDNAEQHFKLYSKLT